MDEADQPWHTSSTRSPSPSSSLRSPYQWPSWRSVFALGTIGVLAGLLVDVLTRPSEASAILTVLAIPAVSISLSYFGGASIHTAIAYTTIRQEATRSRAEYLRLIDEEILPPAIQKIEDHVDEKISGIHVEVPNLQPQLDELKERIDTLDVGKALTDWLSSDDGREWTGQLAGAAGSTAADAMAAQLTSKAGAAARTAQSKLESLLEGAVHFDNPILDGIWAAAPKADKRRAVARLARILRKAGVFMPDNVVADGEIVDAEYEPEAPVQDGDAPALADPGDAIEWPPRG